MMLRAFDIKFKTVSILSTAIISFAFLSILFVVIDYAMGDTVSLNAVVIQKNYQDHTRTSNFPTYTVIYKTKFGTFTRDVSLEEYGEIKENDDTTIKVRLGCFTKSQY